METKDPWKDYKPAVDRFSVGVVIEKKKLSNPWIDHVWLPAVILPEVPAAEPWTVLTEAPEFTQVYAGAYDIELHSSETRNYRSNLESGDPRIWVRLTEASGPRPVEVSGVTVDPAEGEAYTEVGTATVEALPMPEAIRKWVAAFVAEHHIEREFFKRRRDQV